MKRKERKKRKGKKRKRQKKEKEKREKKKEPAANNHSFPAHSPENGLLFVAGAPTPPFAFFDAAKERAIRLRGTLGSVWRCNGPNHNQRSHSAAAPAPVPVRCFSAQTKTENISPHLTTRYCSGGGCVRWFRRAHLSKWHSALTSFG